jgi:hypothetical protein
MPPAWSATHLVLVSLALSGGTVGKSGVSATLMASAQAEPGQGALIATLAGSGVQVWRCETAGGAAPSWVLDHPEADLLDAKHKVVGHHDAGPSWRFQDGSMVRGEVLEKKAAPEPGAVPWLLLRATTHEGGGVMAAVETIRRVDTRGGVAPVQGCDPSMVGATVRVPYSATYMFYGKP